MATVKKQARKESANPHDSFAAVQLLNDPQVPYPITPYPYLIPRTPYPTPLTPYPLPLTHTQHAIRHTL